MAAAATRQRHVCQSIVSSHKPVSGNHGGRRPRGIITLLDALILPFFQHFQLQHLLRLCSHRRTVSVSRLVNIPADVDATARPPSRSCGYSGEERGENPGLASALPFAPSLLRSLAHPRCLLFTLGGGLVRRRRRSLLPPDFAPPCRPLGPCTNDVSYIFGIFYPPPSPCQYFGTIYSTKITQPRLLPSEIG